MALASAPERALATTLFERLPADPFTAGTLFSDLQASKLQRPREAATFFVLGQEAALTNLVWWGGYFSEVPVSDPGSTSPFEVRLFADTGSGPALSPFAAAAVTAAVSPFPPSMPFCCEFEYAATLPQPIALAAGSYWISIVDVDLANPTFAWRKSTEASHSFSRPPGEAWNQNPGLASVRLEGRLVPEPGTAGLAALGLAALGAARARRARA